MANDGGHSVDTTPLWEAAQRLFIKEVGEADQGLVKAERATLQETISDLHKTQEKASRQYSDHSVHFGSANKSGAGRAITVRLKSIFDKLNLLCQLGDAAMEAAPESVSLVWMGFRLIFKGLLSDKNTCEFLSAAVDQISGVIIVCEIYIQRYSGQNALVDQFTNKGRAVLDQIAELFAIVLRFSYLTQKLFSHSKVVRTLSETLGGKSYDLKDAVEEARMKLATLRETDQINYQEETLRLLRAHNNDSVALARLEEMSRSAFQEIESTAVSIRNIESEMYKSRDEDRRAEVQRKFQSTLQWFKKGQIAEYQTLIGQHLENVGKRHQGSCQWIFQDKDTPFIGWKAGEAGFLWLVGRAGFGKSVLVSTIIERFRDEKPKQQNDQSPILLFFFCKRGDKTATKACRIMLYLCYQLLTYAEIDEDTTLQEKYNESLKEVQRKFSTFVKIDPSQVDIPAVHELFETLVKQQHRPIVLIVDALDECEDWDDSGFIKALLALSNSASQIRVLVSSRQLDSELLQDVPRIEINNERTQYDIAYYVAKSVQSSKRNWNREKTIKVIEGIRQNSPGDFKCEKPMQTREPSQGANLLSEDAATKMESLKEPGLVESFHQFMQDLKPGMNSAYRQTFEKLTKGQRHLLVVALRWLICGRDSMPIEYIADEVELNWDEESIECEDNLVPDDSNGLDLASKVLDELDFDHENKSDNLGSDHQATYDTLERVGRDFVKVENGQVSILHTSVRDFIKSSGRFSRTPSELCDRCRQNKEDIDLELLKASEKHGHLLMAEHLLHKLNSDSFQKKYILIEGFKTGEEQGNRTRDHMEDDAMWTRKYQRYELRAWLRHLREAECAWTIEEQKQAAGRWKSLLDAAEHFLDPESIVYKSWVRRVIGLTREKAFFCVNPLAIAALTGSLGLMERYLSKQDCEVDSRDADKNTPLLLLCRGKGRYRGLESLVRKGADVNAQNRFGLTPLITVIREGTQIDPIRFLLDNRANPTIPDNRGWTPLHFAASQKKQQMCELLLEYPFAEEVLLRVDAKDNEGETPLHKACKWANTPGALITVLLDHKADPNFQDRESQAPLYEACRSGNLAAARVLLQYDADINDDDITGDTALHAAVYAGSLDCTKLLIEKGIDISKKNQRQRTALAAAADYDKWDIFDFLIDEYVSQSPDTGFLLEADAGNWIPLHHFAWCHSDDTIRKLLEIGDGEAMCRVRDNRQDTPLHVAAWRGNVAVVRHLLDCNPPLDWPGHHTAHGDTPIDQTFHYWQIATDETGKYEEVIELLASRVKMSNQMHKFQCAIEKGSTRLCKLFLDLKNKKDDYEWTPTQLAVQCRNPEIISLLSIDDATMVAQSPHGRFPSRWSVTDKSHELDISMDGMEISVSDLVGNAVFENYNRLVVRSDHPVPFGQDRFYFEIEVLESRIEFAEIGLGYCSRFALLNKMPGWDSAHAPTWGYHADDGEKYFWLGDSSVGESYAEKWGIGDVVGCGVDFANETIYFTKNGQYLGTAFRDVKGRLFPVCGMGSKSVRIRANFGQNSNVPFRYRDWQTVSSS